jgi:hypothetical protein
MTPRLGGRIVVAMRNRRLTPTGLIVIALTAVFSLAAGHATDLGAQLLSSGPPSTPALAGDVAGLIACAVSAGYGLRHLDRSRRC